ncbi:carbamate kinase [Aeromonas caviae]|jgi:carbamate kinase|uniref:carbamate kinase n=1 Tax=Aeromonas TaxID=642 RepID=UPI0002197E8F|nr:MULTISPECIES: carbamate kinase [Aeromonas]MBL0510502.1 carbamate kinase [Aeromonas caviae]MCE9862361.1 carbamate kinase [Aeromonas caviae]MDU4187500.1 carbamate kinase [Aeromonas sp.]MDX7864688.1 carbamate kinase [Aeromonas caviae]NBA30337.1 carbamate kinase [Aeromonas caviae]
MKKPTVVVALGGNALLRRGEPLEADIQRKNIATAAKTIALIAQEYNVVLVHGNGPQVGLLALQNSAYTKVSPYPLDVLGAESQGMIGYMLIQELKNLMPSRNVTALLTQVQVDPQDPAFANPTKFIGPVYEEVEARALAAEKQWSVKADGKFFRRVVPSPLPQRIVEGDAIETLIAQGHLIICTGGGGIPVTWDGQSLTGIEAVIDKDMSAAYLAKQIKADALLILTDADAVYLDWGKPTQRPLRVTSPDELAGVKFDAGSMGPKVEASCEFVKATGGMVGIGSLEDGLAILKGEAGTNIVATHTVNA